MTKYEVILYWSEEDQAFIAEVPELSGCAADGATRTVGLAGFWEVQPEKGEPKMPEIAFEVSPSAEVYPVMVVPVRVSLSQALGGLLADKT